jgi:hypothetical protein
MIYMIETSSYLCRDCEMSFILLPYSFCSSNKRTIILQKEKNMKCILVKQRRSQNMNKRKKEWRVNIKEKNDEKVLEYYEKWKKCILEKWEKEDGCEWNHN